MILRHFLQLYGLGAHDDDHGDTWQRNAVGETKGPIWWNRKQSCSTARRD